MPVLRNGLPMSVNPPTTSALAVRQPPQIECWRGVEWQKLWLSLQARPWTALAIVPASSGGPPDFAVTIAATLARTGMVHLGAPIHVADGTLVELSNVMLFQEEIRYCRDAGDRILLALAPMDANPLTETLAQSADCSLLCVLFEDMRSGDARRTVDKLGRERFVGSSIFRAEPGALST